MKIAFTFTCIEHKSPQLSLPDSVSTISQYLQRHSELQGKSICYMFGIHRPLIINQAQLLTNSTLITRTFKYSLQSLAPLFSQC